MSTGIIVGGKKNYEIGFKAPVLISPGAASWSAPASGIITLYIKPASTTTAIRRYSKNNDAAQGIVVNTSEGLVAQSSIPVAKGDVIKSIYTSRIEQEFMYFYEYEIQEKQ